MTLDLVKYNKPEKSISAENSQFSIVASGGSRLAGAPACINIFQKPTDEKPNGIRVASYEANSIEVSRLLNEFTANHNRAAHTAESKTADSLKLKILTREASTPITIPAIECQHKPTTL